MISDNILIRESKFEILCEIMPIIQNYEYSGVISSMEMFAKELEKLVDSNALSPKYSLEYINSVK